ncbi:MAG: DUF4179 domain-containing protein [Oscillospiraceae bacterium]|nr:DUF4179 domain-containing protein [Oscillospiraceae bacterium]
MKEKIIFNEKIDIPDIVNDKCNMAYEQIRNDAVNAPKKIHHKKKATVITIAVAAALACGVPVAASYFKSAFSFVSQEVYTKNPAMKIDLSPYAKDVNKSSAQTIADITMQSVYCDGENLSVALALKPINEELKTMTRITAYITTTLNDTRIKTDPGEMQSTVPINFYASDDGTFYAIQNYQQLSVKENSALELQISSLKGFDDKHVTWVPDNPNDFYRSGGYMPAETDVFSDKFSFEATVSPDTSNNKLYEVNETQGGITLESVFVTPFKTEIKISGFDNNQSCRVLDNDGNKLEFVNYYPEENIQSLSSPLKTAKQLKIEVYNLDTDNFPAEYTFTVDIEKGFAEKYIVEWDDSDIVYNPPFEEMEKHWEEEEKKESEKLAELVNTIEKVPVNTPVNRKEWFWLNEDGTETAEIETSQKIVGSEIDDVEKYTDEIRDEAWVYMESIGLTAENSKMLLITYEIENKSDVAGSMCFDGFDMIYTKNFELMSIEPRYMPDKENGGKSSYFYDFEPYETKTITFGYVIAEEYADDGFYVLNYGDNAYSNSMYHDVKDGNISVMEIE